MLLQQRGGRYGGLSGALRRVALFHGMGDRELLSMLDCLGARLRQNSKGDVIFHAGDPATTWGRCSLARCR